MTADTRPAPLVPWFVDLTDFPDMPLEVGRLRDSQIASDEEGEVFRAAVLLWAAAWHQRPAASIPESASWAARVCGYGGRGASAEADWKRIEERALRGFVLCSDGRLYHRVLAAKALAAWDSKVGHRYKMMHDRIRKRNEVLANKKLPLIVIPNLSDFVASGFKDPEPPMEPPREPPRNSRLKGREEKRSKEENPPASRVPPTPRRLKKCPKDFELTPQLRAWGAAKVPGLDLDAELEAMKDHDFAVAKSDWPGTFRNWCRRSGKSLGPNAGKVGSAREPSAADKRTAALHALTKNRSTRVATGGADDDPRPQPPAPDDVVEIEARRIG